MARLHAADELVPGPLGYLPVSGSQDVRTVKLLRLGVGVIGCLLPHRAYILQLDRGR